MYLMIFTDMSSSVPNPVGPYSSTSAVDQQSMYYDTFVALWRYTAQKVIKHTLPSSYFT